MGEEISDALLHHVTGLVEFLRHANKTSNELIKITFVWVLMNTTKTMVVTWSIRLDNYSARLKQRCIQVGTFDVVKRPVFEPRLLWPPTA